MNDAPSPATGIRGVVRRADGAAPVGGAAVEWFRAGVVDPDDRGIVSLDGAGPPAAGRAVTGSDGSFVLDVPAGTSCRVVATADGLGVASDDATAPATVTLTLAAERSVTLRFIDAETRKRVPGVTARIVAGSCDGPVVATIRGDAAGSATRPLSRGTHLVVDAPGYVPRALPIEPPAADGKAVAVIDVELQRADEIAGRVVDSTGRAVAGASVRLKAGLDGDRSWLDVRSDDEGKFRFAVHPDPEFAKDRALRAEADGYGPVDLKCYGGERDLRIVLQRAAWVEGRVVDEQGRPVTDFEMRVGRNLGGGRFEMGPLAPGAQGIRIDRPRRPGTWGAYDYGRDAVVLAPGERRTDVVVTLYANGGNSVVRGRVVDPMGNPVGHAAVVVTDPAGGAVLARAETDAEGVAAVARVEPPGTPFLLAAAPPVDAGTWVQGRAVRAFSAHPDAAPLPTDLALLAGRAFTLRVLDHDGTELAWAGWGHGEAGEGFRSYFGRIVAAPGASVMLPYEVDGRILPIGPVSVDGAVDGVLTVQVPREISVRGRVVAPEDATITHVGVVLRLTPRDGSPATNARTEAAGDGTFVLRRLPPDCEAALDVGDDRGGRVRRSLTLGSDDIDLGEIPLPALVPFRGVVTDDGGRPVPAAIVQFAAEGEVRASAKTDANGAFELQTPGGLAGVVTARRGNDISGPVEVVTGGDSPPVRIRVRREAWLIVRASFARERNVRISYRAIGREHECVVGTGNSGTPTMSARIPAGEWDLRVTFRDREWTRRVSVEPGGGVEWNLDD